MEWWGDPARSNMNLVSGDLDEPAMDQFIVSAGGAFAICNATI
jgi:aminoglycoside 6'-N-acetyltransferase